MVNLETLPDDQLKELDKEFQRLHRSERGILEEELEERESSAAR